MFIVINYLHTFRCYRFSAVVENKKCKKVDVGTNKKTQFSESKNVEANDTWYCVRKNTSVKSHGSLDRSLIIARDTVLMRGNSNQKLSRGLSEIARWIVSLPLSLFSSTKNKKKRCGGEGGRRYERRRGRKDGEGVWWQDAVLLSDSYNEMSAS